MLDLRSPSLPQQLKNLSLKDGIKLIFRRKSKIEMSCRTSIVALGSSTDTITKLANFEARFLARLCCYFQDIARHGSNLCILFRRILLDLFFLKLMFSLSDWNRNLPIIIKMSAL